MSVDKIPSLEELAKLMDSFPSADQIPDAIFAGTSAYQKIKSSVWRCELAGPWGTRRAGFNGLLLYESVYLKPNSVRIVNANNVALKEFEFAE
jgi:hypothetical protein